MVSFSQSPYGFDFLQMTFTLTSREKSYCEGKFLFLETESEISVDN